MKYTILAALLVLNILNPFNFKSEHIYSQTSPEAQQLPYSEDFSSLSYSSSSFPGGWQGWKINSAPTSLYSLNEANANTILRSNANANTATEGVLNYKEKIGFLTGTTSDYTLALAINTSGDTNIVVQYEIMTIRNPYDGSSNTRINGIELQYRIGTSGNFKSVNSRVYINNTSKQLNSSTSGQNRLTFSVTLPDECNNRETVHIRWISRNISGSGLMPSFAIDNVDIRQNGNVDYFYYGGTGALNSVHSWWSEKNRTGSHPSNFTSDNMYFIITNTSEVSNNSNWNVNGTNSKVIVGDGYSTTTLRTTGSSVINGIVDVETLSSLNISQNTSNLMTLGCIYPGSGIEILFNASLSSIPGEVTYENLVLNSGGGHSYRFTQGSSNLLIKKNFTLSNTQLDINGSNKFRLQVGGSITLSGNASFSYNFKNNCELYLYGSGNHTFTGNGNSLNINGLTLSNNNKLILSNTGGSSAVNIASGSSPFLTMAGGNIELNTNSVTLGSSSWVPGTLNHTSGFFTGNGSFARWFSNTNLPTSFIESFPMGTDTNSRSIQIKFSNSNISAGGMLKVSHSDIEGTTPLIPFNDNSLVIDKRSNMSWSVQQSGGWNLGSRTIAIRLTASGLPGVSDISDLSLIKETTTAGGSFAASTGSVDYPQVNRASMSITMLGGTSSANTFYIGASSNSALPVVLSSFSSVVKNRNIKLMWTTETETNNSGFDIERRTQNADGKTYSAWEKITFINGNGNSSQQHVYNYEDKQLNTGKFQYRLKQVDYNGNHEYFNLESPQEIIIGNPILFDMSQNYPNPSNPNSKINFQVPFTGKVKIIVYDISGKEVSTLVNETKDAGYHTADFDGTNLASGIYLYRITAENQAEKFTKTMKLVLVK